MGCSLVIVEDADTALREAGDVLLAVEEGELTASDLRTLRQVVLEEVGRVTDRAHDGQDHRHVLAGPRRGGGGRPRLSAWDAPLTRQQFPSTTPCSACTPGGIIFLPEELAPEEPR